MKIPIRVASADGICQNVETNPNGSLFACANRVYPNGTLTNAEVAHDLPNAQLPILVIVDQLLQLQCIETKID